MLTGRTLGKYRLFELLGRGGMGEVYRAQGGGQTVAIKVLPQDLARAGFLKWFERESDALRALDHPNIVRFHEAGESEGLHYLVLDFIDGRALSEIIRQRGRLPFGEVREYLQTLGNALDYAHARGLVHRDIKPSNIMLRRNDDEKAGEAILMDFGVARTTDARTKLTSTGAIGTIGYMAPEQIMATATVDCRADIYALGVTLYEMLTGELPFNGNPAQVMFAHLQQQPTDLGMLFPDLPASVSHGVMKAMEKKPENRFHSAGEFVVALSGTLTQNADPRPGSSPAHREPNESV